MDTAGLEMVFQAAFDEGKQLNQVSNAGLLMMAETLMDLFCS